MSESVKPSIRETIEADLALAEKATPGPWIWNETERWLESSSAVDHGDPRVIIYHTAEEDEDADFIARARTAVPDYASRLLRVLDLCDKWACISDETGALPERVAELRRAIEGGEG